ncbi:hypothetical protein PVAND_014627 [Polypedilum vanderplanki]|uniref:Uncharacterized protein n=1 Tax=Polypedilum vanderplanki TaxID=319348 RepID=A0A9J6BAR5_POLVA|nr:hypothetical protein PVAND_014627 [Polypedilum vanderplanki]
MEILNNNSEQYFMKLISTVDQNCVKEKLKLATNGQKRSNFSYAMVLVTSAYSLCVENVDELANHLNTLWMREIDESTLPDNVECYMKELFDLEPNSEIFENLNEKNFLNFNGHCNENIFKRYLERFVTTIIDVEKLFCSENEKIISKISNYKLVILKMKVRDEKVKNLEKQKLMKSFQEIVEKSIECGLKML